MQTGTPWTLTQIQSAIDWEPHILALIPAAMKQLEEEVYEKLKNR